MKIAVLGYGIQGRAQSLNLRDSGHDIVIGNINDKYSKKAKKDGFHVYSIKDAVKKSKVIMILLPDEVQERIINNNIIPNLQINSCIVFAHGYWLTFNKKNIPKNVDILMIAPRSPGEQIRKYYTDGHGVPAYIHVVRNVSGKAQNILNKLVKSLGFDKGGLIKLSYDKETKIDLMIEQVMAPIFFGSVQSVFRELVNRGFPAEVVCLELYYSGELGDVRTMMGRDGLYTAFKNNASPTCQFGVASSISRVWKKNMDKIVKLQLERIENGKFAKELKNYDTKKTIDTFINSKIAKKIKITEKKVSKKINKR
tara:strand:+ start:5244 stop:6176 length:933 start_codon:yes stop_codon:yes gene_type:complete